MPKRDHTYVCSGLVAQLFALVDDSANQRYQNTLCLIALNQIYAFLCGGRCSEDNSYARDVAGYQRNTQLTDYSVTQMPITGSLIRFCTVNIFQCLNKFCTECGCHAGHERVIQAFLSRHQCLYNAQSLFEFPQGCDLSTCHAIVAGQAVRGVREGNCLVSAVFCDGVVDGSLGQTVYGIISTKYYVK